jgi:hypothetical protein
MTPGKIEGATVNLGAPRDWSVEQRGACDPLWIRERDGTMESAWYPSDEEKRLIAEGRPVVLSVWGTGHPPVSLNVNQ